jgi:hypothetical protein
LADASTPHGRAARDIASPAVHVARRQERVWELGTEMPGEALEEGVADCASEDDADVSTRIDGFREAREAREHRAAIGVFVLGMIIAAFGAYFGDLAKHMGWPPYCWPVGFGAAITGQGIAYTLTERLDFERGFGEVSLAQLRSPRDWIWLPALLALWASMAPLMPTMYSKYGVFYSSNYVFIGGWCSMNLLVALSKGQINVFSPAVTAVPLWKRRPTLCEWLSVSYGIGMWVYILIYADLWHRGQWEGALLGANASCLLLILVHCAFAAR